MTLPDAQRELAQAHAALAAVFAKYPLRGTADGCPCCVSAADHAELRSGNLRRYAFKAMTTWGSEADFKHFLPALLSALTPDFTYYPGTIHEGACDLRCFAGKLAYAHWQAWPAEEQQVVLDCLRAWWLVCLALLRAEFAEFLAGRSADGWGNSAGPAYQELAESELPPAAWLRQLWYEALQPAPSQPVAAYVKSPAFLLLVDWLHHFLYRDETMPVAAGFKQAAQRYLEEGFFQYADLAPKLAQRLSDLLYCLENSTPPATSGAE
ncbi:hypothetical protein Q5H89_06100 [Hymenobacter sp. CA2-7]|nr:hypothetical protein [Hymenobacter sp. CA2-7]